MKMPAVWQWGSSLICTKKIKQKSRGRITGLLNAVKGVRETACQFRIDLAAVCRWRDRFCATGEVKKTVASVCWKTKGDISKTSKDVFGILKVCNFSDVTQSHQLSTILFASHSFVTNKVKKLKANTPTHMGKHTELFLCRPVLK